MNAAELREALEAHDDVLRYSTGVLVLKGSPIFDAARERLAQLEADPELVERIAAVINEGETWSNWDGPETARQILAAITTPTPGAE